MEQRAQNGLAPYRPAEALKSAAHGTLYSRLSTDGVAHEPAALRSVVHLLREADRALAGNKDDARRYIVRATALLQAEADFRDPEFGDIATATRCQLAPWQVTRVLRFIDGHLGEKIGPKNFAAVARLSNSHFAHAFRATVGEAPYAYLIRRRVGRAKELMLETDFPLAQIALECGLADQAHMTRLFTRIVGTSPGAWRRAHLAAAPMLVQHNVPFGPGPMLEETSFATSAKSAS